MKNIYRATKYVHSPDRSLEWYEYMVAYLKASRCLAEKHKQLNGNVLSEKSELLIPLLFNVRHCIELFLKFLSYETPEKPQHTHNISIIFKNFQDIFEKLDKPQLSMIAKHLQISRADVENAFRESVIRLEDITNKYYGFAFLFNGDFRIEDPKNEVFRYPVNFNTDFKLDLENLHSSITADEILNDLDFLFSQAFIFLYTFTVTSEGAPMYDVLRDWANRDNKLQ